MFSISDNIVFHVGHVAMCDKLITKPAGV